MKATAPICSVALSTIVAPGPGKAMSEDAAFEVFAKGLTHKGLWRVVVTLAVELAATCEFMLGLEVFGYGLVEQSPLGVAWVVELGLCTGLSTRMRMRLRWACSGGHGAVPAWEEGYPSQAGIQSQVNFRQPYCIQRPDVTRERLSVTHWSPHSAHDAGRPGMPGRRR